MDDFMTDPTKVSIWISLLCYFVAMTKWLRANGSETNYRGWWTIGCVAYVLHVVAAFGLHHEWSHAAAYEQTARQTADVVGRAFGAGIFVNYLFTLLWIGEVICWRGIWSVLGGVALELGGNVRGGSVAHMEDDPVTQY
ncbi:MAG: hypothetical protein ACJASX_000012 [Limisphaerales bacterium]